MAEVVGEVKVEITVDTETFRAGLRMLEALAPYIPDRVALERALQNPSTLSTFVTEGDGLVTVGCSKLMRDLVVDGQVKWLARAIEQVEGGADG